uniref:Uncharacterized protein n=1 Tax=Arundo donax TaxID=35708 RepID=A0A0A9F7N3_ARUDO
MMSAMTATMRARTKRRHSRRRHACRRSSSAWLPQSLLMAAAGAVWRWLVGWVS